MKLHLTISICVLLLIACKEEKPQSTLIQIPQPIPKLVTSFESELAALDDQKIESIDLATELFQKYATQTEHLGQRDSLFMPYFNVYNYGRSLLQNEEVSTIEKYGFAFGQNSKKSLVPHPSQYLSSNIIVHLSPEMQSFCNQQLKEFSDTPSLATIAANALWWEDFNQKYPDFFLKEMTDYHYKNWHLKNLLMGTNQVAVFSPDGKLLDKAEQVYQNVLKEHPNSQTSNVLVEYLELLQKDNLTKSEAAVEFLKQFE
ncbi:MAG: hypothetical protein AB8G22_04235 [Saprospiraceae bacterium]